MKTTTSPCCGSYSKKRIVIAKEPLPPNPKVQGGTAIIYLGSGNISFKGEVSGSMYFASDHNRHLKVHTADVESILKDKTFILKP